MSSPISWWWPAIAAIAAALAIATSSTYAISAPAATAAVVAAAFAIVDALRRAPSANLSAARGPEVPLSYVRDWFGAGALGREDLVLLVDRLERSSLRPDLPARTGEEMAALVQLPPTEFRRYLTHRLDRLEGVA